MTPAAFHKLAAEKMAEAAKPELWSPESNRLVAGANTELPEAHAIKMAQQTIALRRFAVMEQTRALSALARLAAEHGFKLLSGEATGDALLKGSAAADRLGTPLTRTENAWKAMHAAAPDMLGGE